MGINDEQLQQIIVLINKSINTELSANEQHMLEQWLNMHKNNHKLFDELHNPDYRVKELQEMSQFTAENVALSNFLHKHDKYYLKTKRNLFISRLTAAAVITVIMGASLYFYINQKTTNETLKLAQQTAISVGKNTATLTLNDGKMIKLSELQKGVIVNSSGVEYVDGSPVEQAGTNTKDITMLTASTPRGGMYAITLPDGTKAWLNSQSSIQFPSSFANNLTRKVTLIGEAYFEVAKYKAHPFIVVTKMQEVKVLGTHFNINAYADDNTTITTLLEGSVSVLNLNSKQTLNLISNQQAVVSNSSLQVKYTSDAENAIDWKNGDFVLKEERLETIMRKLARWYDVEIIYSNKPQKSVMLGGIISRQKTLVEALRFIETTEKVHFEIEHKKVIVSYK